MEVSAEESGLHSRAGLLTPLLDALVKHRGLLAAAYLIILAAWLAAFLRFGMIIFAESFHWLFDSPSFDIEDDLGLLVRIIIIAAFFTLQGLFVWGGGRIRLDMQKATFRTCFFSLIIFCLLMGILTLLMVFGFAEMVDRFLGQQDERWGIFPAFFAGRKSNTTLPLVLVPTWILWLWIGWLSIRHVDKPTASSRLIAILLAGSWIEFCCSLPIELGTRPRTKECPCRSGSWMALMMSLPVLLWAIGPGIYFLYVRQRGLAVSNHRHTVKVLLGKSRRSKRT